MLQHVLERMGRDAQVTESRHRRRGNIVHPHEINLVSPTQMYRTAPLAGLWTHQKGGFFHDGRFATLADVVNHYDAHFNLNLSDANKKDLIEYLKGI